MTRRSISMFAAALAVAIALPGSALARTAQFQLDVLGTQTTEWTETSQKTDPCTDATAGSGKQTIYFRTEHPAPVSVATGQGASAGGPLGNLPQFSYTERPGGVTLEVTVERHGSVVTTAPEDPTCPTSLGSNPGAIPPPAPQGPCGLHQGTLRFELGYDPNLIGVTPEPRVAPRPGQLALQADQPEFAEPLPLLYMDCPFEIGPGEVSEPQGYLVRAFARLPVAWLFDPRRREIVLRRALHLTYPGNTVSAGTTVRYVVRLTRVPK